MEKSFAGNVHRGVEQLVARQAHNLEVARSSPASATITSEVVDSQRFGRFPVFIPDSFQTQARSQLCCNVSACSLLS